MFKLKKQIGQGISIKPIYEEEQREDKYYILRYDLSVRDIVYNCFKGLD